MTKQRPIKFRAWDKERGQFLYSSDFDFDSKFWIAVELAGAYDYVQRYTGLKDKNGKEIYEGDIVDAVATKEDKESDRIADVIFGTGLQWQIRAGKGYSRGLPITWGGWKSLEVIGDIYENPELIKQK